MKQQQKVMCVDARTGFYKVERYDVGQYFGPVDLGMHLSDKYDSLNIGSGLLAGSIFPGSNRMVFTARTRNWGGFYISSMGGASIVLDNVGINMLSIMGEKAPQPCILYLNRIHGEEIRVETLPVDPYKLWNSGRGGVYSVMDYAFEQFGDRYEKDPRVLAVGPASASTDAGAIGSVPIKKGELNYVDTWAGRGGLGSKLFQQFNIVGIIYGGTYIEDDFRDRKVADQWFMDKYQNKLAAQDLKATTKYRYNPKVDSGGTFGVNFTTQKGRMMAFNYKSNFMSEEDRLKIHKDFIVNHYLKQFNEETIKQKKQQNCGEPCVALCKKMRGEYKKDYEPYQTMGPLSGIFDQRAAEKLNHHADMYGFDAISIGGVIAWFMECLDEGYLNPEHLGVSKRPMWNVDEFDVVESSMHNADLGIEILDAIVEQKAEADLTKGARHLAKRLSDNYDKRIMQCFIYVPFSQRGWMVPNQYWQPGTLSPMPIMGKYYNYYGADFMPPRELGRENANKLMGELILDNLGVCRFHRAWAEEMMPEIMGEIYGLKDEYLQNNKTIAKRLLARNSSVFWETERTRDFVYSFLLRCQEVEEGKNEELNKWIEHFEKDKLDASLSYWHEILRGIQESLIQLIS